MQKYTERLSSLLQLIEDDKRTVINQAFQRGDESPEETLQFVTNEFEKLNYAKMVINTAIDRINNLPEFLNQQ